MSEQPDTRPFLLENHYEIGHFFDEMFEASGLPHSHYEAIYSQLCSLSKESFEEQRRQANISFLYQGVTFTVYRPGGRGD
jgi:uncharacterized circularly permuted ATP-grasp superfamily protein